MSKIMEKQIMDLVKERPGTSFVEIKNHIKDAKGESSITFPDKNIFVHGGLSEDACTSIKNLINEGKLVLSPCGILVYMIDGEVYKIPIAKRFRSYKEERWMPSLLNLPEK